MISIRFQRVSDAKRFYEILNCKEFKFFSAKPASIEEEKKFLAGGKERRKKNLEHDFTILFDGKVVGGGGIKVNQHRKHIGEIGYFIDYDYWGKGIASKAVSLIEEKGKKLGITRFEIYVIPKNKASVKVALKNWYYKESLVRNSHYLDGKLVDMEVYVRCH